MENTPTKPMIDMAKYDDREILMDQTLLHFSQDRDARGIEQAIREEYDVFNGDLPNFIWQNLQMYARDGTTPAAIRADLEMPMWRLILWHRGVLFVRRGLAGFIAGGLGTLLFSHFAQANMPPALWSLRYFILAPLVVGTISTVRQLHWRYRTPYILLVLYTLGAALGAILLFKGY